MPNTSIQGDLDLELEDDLEAETDIMVMARSGHVIDTSGDAWIVSPENVVSWKMLSSIDSGILISLRTFARYLLRNHSPRYVEGQIAFLGKLGTTSVSETLSREMKSEGVVGLKTFEAFKREVEATITGPHRGGYVSAYIRWYLWNVDRGASRFDEDIAATLDGIVIGRGASGEAVMRDDPKSGPLREAEIEGLQNRLRSSLADALPLSHRVVAWLFVCFGTNSKNIRLISEDDLIKTVLNDGSVIYEIRLPRIKKRTAGERDQFRVRRLVPNIGKLVEELIEENRRSRLAESIEDDDYFRPLIRSKKPRKGLIDSAFDRDRYRSGIYDLAEMLSAVADRLDLKASDGSRLRLTSRRLRYTFATKLVKDGASPQEVADALDHTDTQHVMVYFNSRSDIVRRLDLAIGLALAPIAQAFMGQVIRDEAQAARQGDQSSRIRHHSPTMKSLETVGSCGNFGFCGLLAPIACYTCSSFQAWLDAPHKAVFDALEAKRLERLSRGADPKMTQIHDPTMIAIADVIARCDAIHASEANK